MYTYTSTICMHIRIRYSYIQLCKLVTNFCAKHVSLTVGKNPFLYMNKIFKPTLNITLCLY